MATRTIRGTVKHADDSPWVGGEVAFVLVNTFETPEEVYPAETISRTIDDDGFFTVNLGVPDEGTTQYKIHIPGQMGQLVNLGAGAETDLQTILTLASTAVEQNAIQTVIDAANLAVIRTVTSTYQIVAGDQYIRGDGTFTITLPPATGSRKPYLVKNVGSGVITVDGSGSETIDGQASVVLPPNDRCAVMDSVAGKWDAL